MARRARDVFVDLPHHVTQRGNYRQAVFVEEGDYQTYLDLLWQYADRYAMEIWAYCLMSNHVHLIAVPHTREAFARTFGLGHMRYAQAVNRRMGCTGHLWQGRFLSAPLEETYLPCAVRYVERNPVRAGLVVRAEDWPWSSARAHCEGQRLPGASYPADALLADWTTYLGQEEDPVELDRLRRGTMTGRLVGSDSFIRQLELLAGRSLRARPRGRPRKER